MPTLDAPTSQHIYRLPLTDWDDMSTLFCLRLERDRGACASRFQEVSLQVPSSKFPGRTANKVCRWSHYKQTPALSPGLSVLCVDCLVESGWMDVILAMSASENPGSRSVGLITCCRALKEGKERLLVIFVMWDAGELIAPAGKRWWGFGLQCGPCGAQGPRSHKE